MGHLQQPLFPQAPKWREVVGHLDAGAGAGIVTHVAYEAAKRSLGQAVHDPRFVDAVSLLIELPLAARSPDFIETAAALGVDLPDSPDAVDLTLVVSTALDCNQAPAGPATDLGEMAKLALLQSLGDALKDQLPSLLVPEPGEVRTALGRLASGDRFARLARSFFGGLLYRVLDYYLAREMANHIGRNARFADDSQRRAFDAELARHCHNVAGIVEAYAGGWLGKHVYQGAGADREQIRRFAAYAFTKIRRELDLRKDAG